MSSSSSATPIGNPNNQVYCHCNLQCTIYTSYKSRSCGRKFYRCSRNRSEEDCHFFRWCDELNEWEHDMNYRRSSNVVETSLTHVKAELLQIKILLVVLLILMLIIAIGVSKCNFESM
ncbi:hypothetical protein MA16_Dca013661 [Dendrobium catenatum]|uniref:GRF-type domain-containing protein n=1 Tax=Dendrobium catenatum TaxID=906689 RepID=A0A2I0WB43_9ASPA|nr:hypothetical protein MA16_Dca013661 [Dendrobium catenatum]